MALAGSCHVAASNRLHVIVNTRPWPRSLSQTRNIQFGVTRVKQWTKIQTKSTKSTRNQVLQLPEFWSQGAWLSLGQWFRSRLGQLWKLEGMTTSTLSLLELQASGIECWSRFWPGGHRRRRRRSWIIGLHSQLHLVCRRQRTRKAVDFSSKSKVARGFRHHQWPAFSAQIY